MNLLVVKGSYVWLLVANGLVFFMSVILFGQKSKRHLVLGQPV